MHQKLVQPAVSVGGVKGLTNLGKLGKIGALGVGTSLIKPTILPVLLAKKAGKLGLLGLLGLVGLKGKKDDDDRICFQVPETVCDSYSRHKRDVYKTDNCVTNYKTICRDSSSKKYRKKRYAMPVPAVAKTVVKAAPVVAVTGLGLTGG